MQMHPEVLPQYTLLLLQIRQYFKSLSISWHTFLVNIVSQKYPYTAVIWLCENSGVLG